uniref:Fusexin 1 n=1 Tax=Uncultured archaeon TaxID=115547 RepID=FSX1_UNCAX|nr:RecName: Full=Fusexin 1; Short=Fsx1; Flags: Precursor [uncultured archaeon]
MRRAALILAFVLFIGLSSATVTSADSITYNSGTSEFFDGDVFAIEVTADQSTDEIDIYLGASELSEKTDGEVNQDLSIEFTHQDSKLKYSTSTSDELRDIVTLTTYYEDGFDTEQDAIDAIKSDCYDLNQNGNGSGRYSRYYSVTSPVYDYEIYCFQKNEKLATPAYIDNPDEIFTAKAELQAGDKTIQSATLSNGDAGDGTVTDLGDSKISWNGNLDLGASEPENSRVIALYSNDFENGWRIGNKQSYEDYKTFIGGGDAYDLLIDWQDGTYTASEVEDELVNTDANQAVEEASSSTTDLVNAKVKDSSLDTGSFVYDTPELLSYPSFTVYVDAGENGYIEVTKPTGDPDIISTSSTEIKEGDEGTVTATVENVGDGEGEFSGRLSSCGEGFSIVDDQNTKNVGAGESVTYSFDVAFSSVSSESKEISGSCTFEVNGVESSDSTSVSVTGIQQSECNPGDQRREKNENDRWEIYTCQDNGLTYEYDVTCAEDEKAVAQGDNQFSCEKQDDDSGGGDNTGSDSGLFSNLFGGSGSGDLLTQVHTALSILAGLVAGFFGYRGARWIHGETDIKGGFKLESRNVSRVKRGSPVAGIVGAVLGFVVGYGVASVFHPVVQIIVVLGIAVGLYYFR